MSDTICLYGGPLFDGERFLDDGSILFKDQEIISLSDEKPPEGVKAYVDVRGQLILPGLIDLHSDMLEKCIEIRPGVYFDSVFALQTLDQRLAVCGITTICHAISFAEEEYGLRSCQEAEKVVRTIRQFAQSQSPLVRHLVHARYEITSRDAQTRIERLLAEGLVQLVSLMDHTPGQGQFKTLDSYLDYHAGTYGDTSEEALARAERKRVSRERGIESLARFAEKVLKAKVPFLSHDDDSSEKVSLVRSLGVTSSEFPVTLEAAQSAERLKMKVVMGAPNLIRGHSSSGNLKASEALEQGLCNVMASDYYPECLLQAPFIAEERHALGIEKGFRMVTSGPGDYLGFKPKQGRIEPGAPADLIVVDNSRSWARVTQTWVSGRCVFQSDR
jgi:alpha-D-ribose 1-methylphosphonate 5-triphosphate diphosphatase